MMISIKTFNCLTDFYTRNIMEKYFSLDCDRKFKCL